MKKIMLIGQFTDEFRTINRRLIGKYEIRACINQLETFEGMFKLNEPDVVVMLISELDKPNEAILENLKMEHDKTAVLCAGMSLEKKAIPEYLMTEQFEYLERPYTDEVLIQKIAYAFERKAHLEEVPEKKKKEGNTSKEVPQKAKGKELQQGSGKKSILLVDDSGVHLRMMKGLLEEQYDITMTTSGLKAITMVQEKQPDLILLDYDMPMYDGRETMMKLRESEVSKDIPIVFVTAVNDREHIKAVLAQRPTGYLLKPIDRERLFKTIKEIIGE